MMRTIRTLTVGLIVGFILSIAVVVSASGLEVSAVYSNFKIMIDGKPAALSNQPLVVNGRTYLPVAEMASLFNYRLSLNGKTISLYSPQGNNSKGTEKSTKQEAQNEGAGQVAQSVSNLKYHGIEAVVSTVLAPEKKIEGLHHYSIQLEAGSPIDLYVSQGYEDKVGKGFAYEEIGPMIHSIADARQVKPYADKNNRLRLFFINDEPMSPLPLDYQAAANYQSNRFGGLDVEVIVNAGKMPYDFRANVQHELYHYYDFHTINSNANNVYDRYWGEDWRFWLLEGGAEYSSYHYYTYLVNTHNQLKLRLVKSNIDDITAYAIEQSGNATNLLYKSPYISFGQLYEAGSNNYGITLSLFWYLSEQYGTKTIYDYVDEVKRRFDGTQGEITQKMKDQTAIAVLGKTEKQILQDWLREFNTFGGQLVEKKEVTLQTVTHILWQDDTLIPTDTRKYMASINLPGQSFLVATKEYDLELGYTQVQTFKKKATHEFRLEADGVPVAQAVMSGANYSDDKFTDGTVMTAYQFYIPTGEISKLKSGVAYRIVPVNNDPVYRWVFPDDVVVRIP